VTLYAVTCYTCLEQVWKGDVLVDENGQNLLTAYADASCKRATCPHKTAAITAAQERDPLAQIEKLKTRLAALEAKTPNKP
jgi:hypothetical protein